jgi:hypothetical protein
MEKFHKFNEFRCHTPPPEPCRIVQLADIWQNSSDDTLSLVKASPSTRQKSQSNTQTWIQVWSRNSDPAAEASSDLKLGGAVLLPHNRAVIKSTIGRRATLKKRLEVITMIVYRTVRNKRCRYGFPYTDIIAVLLMAVRLYKQLLSKPPIKHSNNPNVSRNQERPLYSRHTELGKGRGTIKLGKRCNNTLK